MVRFIIGGFVMRMMCAGTAYGHRPGRMCQLAAVERRGEHKADGKKKKSCKRERLTQGTELAHDATPVVRLSAHWRHSPRKNMSCPSVTKPRTLRLTLSSGQPGRLNTRRQHRQKKW